MQLQIETLTEQAFEAYGRVLGQPDTAAPNLRGDREDVWLGLSDLMGLGAAGGKDLTYLKVRTRPNPFNILERHVTCAEAFVPLEGQSVIVVAPAGSLDPNFDPDLSQARAFYLDGSKGVLLKRGTWHTLPYNLTEVATYIVMVDQNIIHTNDVYKRNVGAMELIWPVSTEAQR